MQIVRSYKNIPEYATNTVLALGNFDGIHLGHTELLKQTIKVAKEKKLKSALISFEPHPLQTLHDTKNIRIFSLQDKIKFVKNSGIDILFLFRFTGSFAAMTAEEFLTQILVNNLRANHIVIGYDFIFGKNRSGNGEYLKKNSIIHNYGFTKILPHKCETDNVIYSSTEIRKYLKEGKLQKVRKFLGKNYSITGRVIRGKNLGSKIGYATANIALNDLFRPKFGVYAVKIHIINQFIENKSGYDGVANIGIRPTFTGNEEFLEVHIFNFSKNIYGAKLLIEFISFIREEKKFNNVEELKIQINKDCKESIKLLSNG